MQKRVRFDFELYFTNGGSLKGEDFLLDIDGDDISDQALADYVIADLRLLMVGQTRILNKEIIIEAHKRAPTQETGQRSRLVDLSHTIEDGYEAGTEFQIGKIEMVTNTGTYLDCPFHRYENGKDLSEIGLDAFTDLEGTVIHVPHTDTLAITETHVHGYKVRNRAVLIHTGWAEFWNTEAYYENHPFLTAGAAAYLRDCGAKLVGIDSHNIDDTRGNSRPVHTTLLGAEVLIVEHLCNLSLLPTTGFTFSATPPKFKGVGTFPVRALAKVLIG
ncbi:cyclase family protein [Spirosoma pollinicola]|uniref:Cyclase n=1 Tax=Spirosoma pollinicola TaxID=2057025 RepID=A0A2K8YZC8_9BACT|nr:cyclase family protein [Spirosoma pollinicola]AUD03000.1 cyclase [Spirosoma pollinicola]